MTVGSLFSGSGGLDLGLERAGHTVQWQIEADAYCRRVLAQHWPHVPCHHDIKTVTAGDLTPVDLLCGGFPCQPVSHAGLQKGTTDDRWLWPEFYRLINALRPRYVLLENVPGLLTANGGSAFRGILADLATSGFDAEWDSLPASAVGAPHLRYRIFLIAYLHGTSGTAPHADRDGVREQRERHGQQYPEPGASESGDVRQAVADAQEFDQRTRLCPSEPTAQRRGRSCDSSGTLADADHQRCVGGRQPEQHDQQGPRWREPDGRLSDGRFFDAPSSGDWAVEPAVGRVAHGVPHRVDRLKALGNAVVPQFAEWLGRRLQECLDEQ